MDGQLAQPGLLAGGDGFGRRTERVAAAGLDLAEHEDGLPPADQVELAGPAAPVPVQDPVARRLVPGGGQGLTVGAQPAAGVLLPPGRVGRSHSHATERSAPKADRAKECS